MHINDIYELRTQLTQILAGDPMDRTAIRALLLSACDDIAEFEAHLEEMALREEAMQD